MNKRLRKKKKMMIERGGGGGEVAQQFGQICKHHTLLTTHTDTVTEGCLYVLYT